MPCCKKGKKRYYGAGEATVNKNTSSKAILRVFKIRASPPLIFLPLSSLSYSATIHPLLFLSL